jgi:hypothetical protein
VSRGWQCARLISLRGQILTNATEKTTVFLQPFELASFNETLPPGKYKIETVFSDPVVGIEPGNGDASALVYLHPRASHPGLARTLTVPLHELERTIEKDKLTGKALTDFFLEEMLDDPMIRLVMQADDVSEADIRALFPVPEHRNSAGDETTRVVRPTPAIATGDGMSPKWGSARPGIGE